MVSKKLQESAQRLAVIGNNLKRMEDIAKAKYGPEDERVQFIDTYASFMAEQLKHMRLLNKEMIESSIKVAIKDTK